MHGKGQLNDTYKCYYS